MGDPIVQTGALFGGAAYGGYGMLHGLIPGSTIKPFVSAVCKMSVGKINGIALTSKIMTSTKGPYLVGSIGGFVGASWAFHDVLHKMG